MNNAADRQFKGKGQCLIPKRSGGNIYMYKIVGTNVGPNLMSFYHGYMKLYRVTGKKTRNVKE